MSNEMNPTNEQELDEILREYKLAITDDTGSAWQQEERIAEAKKAILDWHNKQEATLLDALYWMYSQYCSGGHDFMGAGEDASELLENAGYITTDGAGRIVKNNGDSTAQCNKLKEVK